MRRRLALATVLLVAMVAGCGLGVVGVAPEESPDGGHAAATADAAGRTDDDDDTATDASANVDAGAASDASIPDAEVDAGAKPVFAFEQSAPTLNPSAATFDFTIQPTKAGSFIALIVSMNSGETTKVASVTDNAAGGSNVYASAEARSLASGCQASEIWYARGTRPATKFTVTLNKAGHAQGWILEVSGLRATGEVDKTSTASGTGTSTSTVAVDVTTVPSLLVAGVSSCQTLGAKAAQNPFVSLGDQEGNTAAYFIATATGPVNAAWTNGNFGWNESVAVFH
ncbi:MAG: hypothetical protein U0270_35265 [Labilithrix sp.]